MVLFAAASQSSQVRDDGPLLSLLPSGSSSEYFNLTEIKVRDLPEWCWLLGNSTSRIFFELGFSSCVLLWSAVEDRSLNPWFQWEIDT